MKRNRLFSAALTMTMLFTASALFAQLKVGTNPTTIGTNSNLEVEASTSGRKVIVDKTSGQVTIADGTQAAGKVLTSDANGAASWQTGAAGLGQLRALIQGYSVGGAFFDTFKYTGVDFNDIAGAAVNTATGVVTLPAGTYKVVANITVQFTNTNTTNEARLDLIVNGSLYQFLASEPVTPGNTSATVGGSAIFKLPAAGQITLYGGTPSPGGFGVQTGGAISWLTVEKMQ